MVHDRKLTAIYPGSFDPPTLGHVDVIERLTPLFQKVYVAIGINSKKPNPAFSLQLRKELLEEVFCSHKNVEIVFFDGLLVDCVTKTKASVIVRSARTGADFEQEIISAAMNQTMTNVETLIMPTKPALAQVSSTLIREIGARGHSLKGFIPDCIEERVRTHLSQNDA